MCLASSSRSLSITPVSVLRADNSVNGTPSCANGRFNNGVVRDMWLWGGANSSSLLSPHMVSSTGRTRLQGAG